MERVAVISVILEDAKVCQSEFNNVVAQYQDIVRGRMGIPFKDMGISVVSITVLASIDKINSLTGKLGNIDHITVKTAISRSMENEQN